MTPTRARHPPATPLPPPRPAGHGPHPPGIGHHPLRTPVLAPLPTAFAALPPADVDAIRDHMLSAGILHEDTGMLAIGPEGERLYGRRHFLDLYSVFSSPPLFTVLHGRLDLGQAHETTFLTNRGAPRPHPQHLLRTTSSSTISPVAGSFTLQNFQPCIAGIFSGGSLPS
jgi:hypothetical protein